MNNQRMIPVVEMGRYNVKLHIGKKSRYNTLTDVKFFDDTTLVAANRDRNLLYLISIKDPQPRILDKLQLDNLLLGQTTLPDLIEVHENSVYIVTLDGNVYVCKIIAGVKLEIDSKITVNTMCRYHGVKVNLFNPDELWLASSYKTPGMMTIYNRITGNVKNFPDVAKFKNYKLKDSGFISPELVIITGSSSSGQMMPTNDPYHSLINLYYTDGSQLIYLDGIYLENCQSDAIAIKDNTAFVTCQLENNGVIVRVAVENNRLVRLPDIPAADFAHGIGMAPCKKYLCYSSYATSSAYVVPIE